jgi:hypothetical protein
MESSRGMFVGPTRRRSNRCGLAAHLRGSIGVVCFEYCYADRSSLCSAALPLSALGADFPFFHADLEDAFMRRAFVLLSALLAVFAVTSVDAQRPEGKDGSRGARDRAPDGPGGPGGAGGGFGGGRFQLPIMKALDADGDGNLSEKEIKKAVAALKKLDKDKDGTVAAAELMPDFAGFGPGGAGGPGGFGPGGPGGFGPGGAGGAGGPGGFRGFAPPDPKDVVNRVMEFDVDKDGKLSRDELTKWAEGFGRAFGGGRGPGQGGADGPRRPQRPE